MGYTTYFSGSVDIQPPLNEYEISFLEDFNKSRRMNRTKGPLFVKGSGFSGQGRDEDVLDFNNPHPDQPGLWCQWTPTADTTIEWDQGEKFYYAAEWMDYIVTNLLAPSARAYIDAHIDEDERLKHFTCNHVVDGVIEADGEESDDFWQLVVKNNKVLTQDGRVLYGPAPDLGPAPAEIDQAIRSITGMEPSEVTRAQERERLAAAWESCHGFDLKGVGAWIRGQR